MKNSRNYKLRQVLLFATALILITSCAPEIKLTSSWANRNTDIRRSPLIMVMALGKANSTTRQDVENNIVARLKKEGYKAMPASELFQPGHTKRDSAELVNTLRKNNIDLLLTNAVISVTENQRFIPGAVQGNDIVVPAGGTATPYGQFNNVYVGYNYYNYYNSYNSYQTIDAPPTPGTTVTDVQVIIESNLYKVENAELIWHGQSRSYTKQPSTSLINTFSKNVIGDIKKNKLLVK
jgi:hypothetical protein